MFMKQNVNPSALVLELDSEDEENDVESKRKSSTPRSGGRCTPEKSEVGDLHKPEGDTYSDN